MRLGFIGTGRMGHPMARKLIEAGHDVRALARSQDKRAALDTGGAHPVARVTEAGEGADAVLVCVFTDEQVRPALASYADPILHVGPLGAGQRVKLINNALFAAHLGLLSSAVDLAAQLGVAESVLLAALPHGSAASRALVAVASRGSVTAFTETVADFLTKDIEVARETAAALGATLGLLDQAIAAALPK